MAITVYFDTYAFYEAVFGNRNYQKFNDGYAIITTRMNLMELFYSLLSRFNKDIAVKYYDHLLPCCLNADDETIKQAVLFRFANKEKRFSYIDCIGYVLAYRQNIPFVTGDRQFEGMPNVEFLK